MLLNEMQERWIRDLKYLEENHAKEIENYEKYFNKETFDKIVNKIKENKNYLIKVFFFSLTLLFQFFTAYSSVGS